MPPFAPLRAAFIESVCRQIASDFSDTVSVAVLDDAALEREGLSLLRAVGQGATTEAKRPRLVVLEHRGRPSGPDTKVALVGKVRVVQLKMQDVKVRSVDRKPS